MEINLSVSRIVRMLFSVLGFILAGSLVVHVIGHTTGRWGLAGISNLFNLDGDTTAPTWFNSILLLLLFLICRLLALSPHPETVRFRRRWHLLSGVFLVMSVDEVAMLHESFGSFLGKQMAERGHELTGFLYFPFVIPGAMLALALFLFYLPLLRALPKRTAAGMVGCGALYLTGVILVECISANRRYQLQAFDLAYYLLTDLEEVCEMSALILLFRVLCHYFQSLNPAGLAEWRFRLGR